MKYSGTISRGVRTPIIKRGDDLASIVVDSVKRCVEEANLEINDKDVVAITEAVVGISQGNYATADQIAKDVKNKFGDDTVGLIFPIMSRNRFSMLLKGISRGVKKVYCLDEILTESVDGSGYNEKYGLLGSNLATDNSVKLFPRDCESLVLDVQARLKAIYNKNVEVMVYGDGAFKDPKGGIWELADPVVSPAYTSGLVGTPNELKLKYISDNALKDLSGEELKEAMIKMIKEKDSNLVGRMETQGTTPRQLTDLLGSLSDLTSGSGDKGTPVILIQNYFSNYSNQ